MIAKISSRCLRSFTKHRSNLSVNTQIARKFTSGACNLKASDTAAADQAASEGASSAVQPARSVEDRDFYLSILKSSSTKREAKSYLQRFTPPKTDASPQRTSLETNVLTSENTNQESTSLTHPITVYGSDSAHRSRTRAYIQRLLNQQQKYSPTNFAVAATATDFFTPEIKEDQVHVALVKIRQVQSIDDETLGGIGRTLVKLKRLGLLAAIVADTGHLETPEQSGYVGLSQILREQTERVVSAIERHNGHARAVDGTCAITSEQPEEVSIVIPNLLVTPLSRGIIPVIAPIAYNNDQKAVAVKADSVILALTQLLSMEYRPLSPENEPRLLSVDRIIFLDPLGGIPSRDRPHNTAHVFLNLQQEFDVVREELLSPIKLAAFPANSLSSAPPNEDNIHLQNLTTLRKALAILPPTSSALITTPFAAATSSSSPKSIIPSSVVSDLRKPLDPAHNGNIPAAKAASRRSIPGRNPLIYNLLTDKPVFSSSLPINQSSPCTHTTLIKHGMPLSIFTNPAYLEDARGTPKPSTFTLKDGTIDLDKLIFLIEDSFGRTLDVDTYLSRVSGQIAGLIIAGDYEGAAIITWETDGVNGDKGEKWKRVPYLDKFAVLRRSQGAGGVADIVFKAMVMGIYPGGVVWRSRSNNPVNKWYFERAKGSWRIPNTNWTMFWTGDGDKIDRERFEQYIEICGRVPPSFKN